MAAAVAWDRGDAPQPLAEANWRAPRVHGFNSAGGPKPLGDTTQDWLPVPNEAGGVTAQPEAEWSWRDEDDAVQLYLLISPTTRGATLDTLNRGGLVMVDIREHLVRVTITDVAHSITYRFQWLNLWAPVDPERSEYHLSSDQKRIVVRLTKVHSRFQAGPWCHFLNLRTGRYNAACLGWPGVLCEVQGAWRSEDEEPIEVVGHQVVWPEGSRDFLTIDEEDETFHLVQWGDGGKIAPEECRGVYERHAHRIRWEDGDYWTRLPGLAVKRREAGKEALPLEYDATLARWVPWLPPEELRQQITRWLPPNGCEISLEVALEDSPGLAVKRELLGGVGDEGEEMLIADFDYLPAQLLSKCRVCALAAADLDGGNAVQTMLALRDGRRLGLDNDAAAFGGLERWLQWLRPWLAPGSRRNVDGALAALKERLFEVAKDERRHRQAPLGAARDKLGCSYERWPPLWTCTMAKPSDLLSAATKELLAELRAARAGDGGGAPDPRLAFGEARRRIAERLFVSHQVPAGSRRCDPLERRWARRYAAEAAQSLMGTQGAAARQLRRELHEGGFAVIDDAVDWGTLVKVQGEVQRLLSGAESAVEGARPLQVSAARGGHARWARVWETRLEELGAAGLAAAVCLMQQLPARLNAWKFGKCSWSAEDAVLWHDDGERLELGRQGALAWAAPGPEGAEDHELPSSPLDVPPEEDELDCPVPPERRILAFLFLNPPAWVPEWGGALRCHVAPSVHRDVWGDGGRLVLLREVRKYELLPACHSHTVLMVRLQGASAAGADPVPGPATSPTEPESLWLQGGGPQGPGAPHQGEVAVAAAGPGACEGDGFTPPAAGEVPAERAEVSPPTADEAPIVDAVDASASEAAQAKVENAGMCAPEKCASDAGQPQEGEMETCAEADGAAPDGPAALLEVDSHRVIAIFEECLSSAFVLD